MVVGTPEIHQLRMRPRLEHLPLVDDGNAVGGVDGGEAVGDGDGGASLPGLIQRLLDDPLALSVQGRGGFVQQ